MSEHIEKVPVRRGKNTSGHPDGTRVKIIADIKDFEQYKGVEGVLGPPTIPGYNHGAVAEVAFDEAIIDAEYAIPLRGINVWPNEFEVIEEEQDVD